MVGVTIEVVFSCKWWAATSPHHRGERPHRRRLTALLNAVVKSQQLKQLKVEIGRPIAVSMVNNPALGRHAFLHKGSAGASNIGPPINKFGVHQFHNEKRTEIGIGFAISSVYHCSL